jgi:hypothetical protein
MLDNGLTFEQKSRIETMLDKAVSDDEFRNDLLSQPKRLLAQFKLSRKEVDVLSEMSMMELEELGIDVRQYRSFLRKDGQKFSL